MNSHVHSAAALVVIDLYIIEVSTEAGILCRLDDNATRASFIDCNRACIAGEHERRACTNCECLRWLDHTVSKGPSDTETKSENRSNES